MTECQVKKAKLYQQSGARALGKATKRISKKDQPMGRKQQLNKRRDQRGRLVGRANILTMMSFPSSSSYSKSSGSSNSSSNKRRTKNITKKGPNKRKPVMNRTNVSGNIHRSLGGAKLTVNRTTIENHKTQRVRIPKDGGKTKQLKEEEEEDEAKKVVLLG